MSADPIDTLRDEIAALLQARLPDGVGFVLLTVLDGGETTLDSNMEDGELQDVLVAVAGDVGDEAAFAGPKAVGDAN